jgi:hypothetical protein
MAEEIPKPSGPAEPTPTPRPTHTPKPVPGADLQPYELEPAAPTPAPLTPMAPSPPKLSDKGLIDDMPEDADFEYDPEVERALKGGKAGEADKASKDTVDAEVEPSPPLVKPGFGDAKTTALVGAGIAIAAVIAASVGAPVHWFLAGVLALYFVVIHTITGVAALAAAAKIGDQPLGSIELAGARMVVAVSLFMFLVSLNFSFAHHWIEPLIACAGYWLALSMLLRVPWSNLFYVAMIHAGLAVVVWIGMVTYAGATAAPMPGK